MKNSNLLEIIMISIKNEITNNKILNIISEPEKEATDLLVVIEGNKDNKK